MNQHGIANTMVTIDYRNCKFQGYSNTAQDRIFDQYSQQNSQQQLRSVKGVGSGSSFGVVVDQYYTWLACQWQLRSIKQNKLAVVFGDSFKMYGFLQKTNTLMNKNNNKNRLLMYEGQGYKLYKNNNIIVLDIKHMTSQLKYQQTFTKYRLQNVSNSKRQKQNMQQIQNIHKNNSRNNCNKNINTSLIIEQYRKYDRNSYMQYLKQLLQIQGQNSHLIASYANIQTYLRNNQPFNSHLNIISSSLPNPSKYCNTNKNNKTSNNNNNLTTHKLHDVSIYLKNSQHSIKLKLLPTLHYRINRIYFENHNINNRNKNRNGEICKKIQYYSDGGGIVQEEVNDQVQAYVDYQLNLAQDNVCNNVSNSTRNSKRNNFDYFGRSNIEVHKYCTKNLQEYFCRSVNFNNNFINLSIIYQYRKLFSSIYTESLSILQTQTINALKNGMTLQNYLCKDKNRCEIGIGEQIGNMGNIDEGNGRKIYEASMQDIRRQIKKTQNMGKSKIMKNMQSSRNINKSKHNKINIDIANIDKIDNIDNIENVENIDNYKINKFPQIDKIMQKNEKNTKKNVHNLNFPENGHSSSRQTSNYGYHYNKNQSKYPRYTYAYPFQDNQLQQYTQAPRNTQIINNNNINIDRNRTAAEQQQNYKGHTYISQKQQQQQQEGFPYRFTHQQSPSFKLKRIITDSSVSNHPFYSQTPTQYQHYNRTMVNKYSNKSNRKGLSIKINSFGQSHSGSIFDRQFNRFGEQDYYAQQQQQPMSQESRLNNQPLQKLTMHYKDIELQLTQKNISKLKNKQTNLQINKTKSKNYSKATTPKSSLRIAKQYVDAEQKHSKSKSVNKNRQNQIYKSKSKNKDNKLGQEKRYPYSKNYIRLQHQNSNRKVSKIAAMYTQIQRVKKQQKKYAR